MRDPVDAIAEEATIADENTRLELAEVVGIGLADAAWTLEHLLTEAGYSAQIDEPVQDTGGITVTSNMGPGVRLTITVT